MTNKKNTDLQAEEMSDVTIEEENIAIAKQQMQLFHMPDAMDKHFSNAIPFFDAIHKFSYGRARRPKTVDDSLRSITQEIKGYKIEATISAASVVDRKTKKPILVFPSEREEIVEEALRKIAVEGGGLFIDGSAGVTFTLYKLQKELKAKGHNYNIAELKEAIYVNLRSSFNVSIPGAGIEVESGIFQSIGLVSRDDFKEDRNKLCYVKFHPLVTEGIIHASYRRYNYTTSLEKIRSPLARHLNKRLSTNYTQASSTDKYSFRLNKFLAGSPEGDTGKKQYHKKRDMIEVLGRLIKAEVITSYDTYDYKEGQKITDTKFTLTPHKKFVEQQKIANKRQRENIKAIQSYFKQNNDVSDNIFD